MSSRHRMKTNNTQKYNTENYIASKATKSDQHGPKPGTDPGVCEE